jgi:hypothetical protein
MKAIVCLSFLFSVSYPFLTLRAQSDSLEYRKCDTINSRQFDKLVKKIYVR